MPAIREFTSADAPGVVSVILPIQQDEFGIPVTLEAQPDLTDITGYYRRGAGNFWVADAQGRIVGTVGLLDIGNNQAALRKMFVVQEFRGSSHGVAPQLLKRVLEWSAARGIVEIFLGTTVKFLAAHRFYEKNGFAEIPKSNLPLSFPIMAVDSMFYRRTLIQTRPE
jgi:N-acetylglutamate synthase-like GNAT family acetyltransferase